MKVILKISFINISTNISQKGSYIIFRVCAGIWTDNNIIFSDFASFKAF